jgi:hypothetical protein
MNVEAEGHYEAVTCTFLEGLRRNADIYNPEGLRVRFRTADLPNTKQALQKVGYFLATVGFT